MRVGIGRLVDLDWWLASFGQEWCASTVLSGVPHANADWNCVALGDDRPSLMSCRRPGRRKPFHSRPELLPVTRQPL